MTDPKLTQNRIKDINIAFFNLHPLKAFDHSLLFNDDEGR